jgi:Domain of unknown function (DUF5911)
MVQEQYPPVEDYGVIGDLRTAALVGRDGSLDFLCYPNFDSPTVFAGLLDHRGGGRFALGPSLDGGTRKQLYVPDTNVLLTRTLHASGLAEVSDFMPVADGHGPGHTIVRRAKCARGEVTFDMVCEPRFDYGRARHSVEARPGEVVGGGVRDERPHVRHRCPALAETRLRARFASRLDGSAPPIGAHRPPARRVDISHRDSAFRTEERASNDLVRVGHHAPQLPGVSERRPYRPGETRHRRVRFLLSPPPVGRRLSTASRLAPLTTATT